jgi:hypothetical protein
MDTPIRDENGRVITVGARTVDDGTVTEITDTDLNSAGTGTVRYVEVRYDGGDVERWSASYAFPGEWVCDEVTLTG